MQKGTEMYWSIEELVQEFTNIQHVEIDFMGKKIPLNFQWLTAEDNMPMFDPKTVSESAKDFDKDKAKSDEKYRAKKVQEIEEAAVKSFYDPKNLSERCWAMIDKANKSIAKDDHLVMYRDQIWTRKAWDNCPDVIKMELIGLILGKKQSF